MEDPLVLITLLAVGLAVFFALQVSAGKKRARSEEKVMKGYFLLGLSGLMAKIAMADGRVTGDEAALASRLFARMELSEAERAICIGNFVTARRDGLDARDHAKRFMAYANLVAGEFLYEILWRISRADGVVEPSEERMLSDIASYLGVSAEVCESLKEGKSLSHDAGALAAAGVPPSLVALAR